MYALVTSDGYALDVVEGPLDEAYGRARELGAHEVVFDESYDLSELFTQQIREIERAANATKKLRRLEEGPTPLRRLSIVADPVQLSPEAKKALDVYYQTGKFPKGIRPAVAVEILRQAGPSARLQAAALFEEPDPSKAPAAAHAAANKIRISMADVMRMTVPDAFERIRALAEERAEEADSGLLNRKTGELWSRYQEGAWRVFLSPAGRDDLTGLPTGVGLLSSNHKMGKGSPVGPVDVMGLSLLPYRLWQLGFDGQNPRRGTFNACIGASPECAQACLVYSGQNTDRANDVKAWRMDAFVREPVAFARILMASIEIFKDGSKAFQAPRWDGFVPFVRLNVLSDLPWELVFPELFEHFSDLSFYDYTKVPGRSTPQNYELTFSWSGMNGRSSDWVWRQGGKVAIVFFKVPQPGVRWPTHEHWRGRMVKRTGTPVGPMPERFLGLEVLDGDRTDVRPYDARFAKGPPPWVVGLRYKAPKAQAFDKARSLFIVPVEEREGVIFAAVVPRDQPGVLEASLQEAADLMMLERVGKVAKSRTTNSGRLKRRLMR